MLILFVFLFLVHELEEILFLPAWLAANRPLLEEKIASRRLLRAIDGVSRRHWIGIAAEELLLVLLLTWLAMAWQLWCLWAGMVVAFSVHLVGHGIQSAILCRPIPSLTTSLLLLPMCVAMIAVVGARYGLEVAEVAISGLAMTGVMVLNLLVMHRLARKFLG